MITEKEIVDRYLGVPYLTRGRNKGTGLDCYGLIMLIYSELGIKLFDIDEDYSVGWAKEGKNFFAENYYREWEKVSTPRMFDIVAFKTSSGVTNHAGVCLGGERFIHCARRIGVVVSKWTDEQWAGCLEGFYKFRRIDANS